MTSLDTATAARNDVMSRWRAIDAYRRTEAGRAERNASRRKVRSEPNADLSGLTPDERKQHKRAQAAERVRRHRAKKATAAAIAA